MGPCPRESCISTYRLEALRLHQKIIFEERVTVKMFFENREMSRCLKWVAVKDGEPILCGVGARGLPARLILSLGAMGGGRSGFQNSSGAVFN